MNTLESEPAPQPSAAVAEAFQGYPPPARNTLFAARRLIFETAANLDEVGPLTETLKWGEPAYLTEQTRSGSTIRLGVLPSHPDHCAVLLNCRTSLISDLRALFKGVLRFEGKRAILLSNNEALPEEPLRVCFTAALTYHLRELP